MVDEIYLNMKEIGYVPEVEGWDEIVDVLCDDFLTIQERKYFLGKLFLSEKKYFEQLMEQDLEVPEEGEHGKWICKHFGVKKSNLNQYARFAIGVDAVAEIIPEFKSLILRFSEEVSGNALSDTAKLSPAIRRKLRGNIQRNKLVVHPSDYGIGNKKEKKEFLVLQIE